MKTVFNSYSLNILQFIFPLSYGFLHLKKNIFLYIYVLASYHPYSCTLHLRIKHQNISSVCLRPWLIKHACSFWEEWFGQSLHCPPYLFHPSIIRLCHQFVQINMLPFKTRMSKMLSSWAVWIVVRTPAGDTLYFFKATATYSSVVTW